MKKLISTLLCLCLFLMSLSTVSMASYANSLVITEVIEDSFIVDVTGDYGFTLSDTYPQSYYLPRGDYDIHYDAYSQLDDAQKLMYLYVVANPGKLSITMEFPDGVFAYSNFVQGYFTEVMNALCTDRPDIFYYAGYSIGGGYLHNNGNYIKTLTYNVTVYDSSLYTSSNLSGYYDTLMSVVPNVPVDLSNRYNFVLSLHDYLADIIYYPDLNSSDYVMTAHDAYGALVEGRAVCQGYSDAFKLICDYYNVPAVCISGTSDGYGHMWNGVQMEDGKWYFIDITWDDQGKYGTYYDFFLVGTTTRDTYFGGEMFYESHVNDSDLCLPNLEYSSTAYDRNQDMFTLFKGTYNSRFNEEVSYLSVSVFDLNKTEIFFNGIYTGITPDQGAMFRIVEGDDSNRIYTVIVVGDPDGDGSLTQLDYNSASDIAVSGDREVNDIEAAACDVNGDGYVDALDLAMLHCGDAGLVDEYVLE